MDDAADERRYAWRMIRATRRAHVSGGPVSRGDVTALLEQAMEAGLDRAELIVALADIGGRLLTLCNPADTSEAGDVCLT